MQYKNYEIQVCEYGCLIRDQNGITVTSTPDESEAREFIDDLDDTADIVVNKDLYEQFERYCNKMPGKCYPIGDKLATTNKNALLKYIKSFSKLNNAKIEYSTQLISNDLFYIVDNVYSL